MRISRWLAALTLTALAGPALAQSESQWQSMFDGQSLEGWHNPYEWGKAKVVDGQIHLVGDRKFFLVSDETYHDFELEVEVRIPDRESNSGVQFRSIAKKNRVRGYQAEVDPSGRSWSGGLYDEARRGWLNPLEGQPEKQEAFNPDQWNHYRIRCEGDRIRIWVNGTQTTDYRDPVSMSGHVALQHHGEEGKVYRFRNPRIKELGRHEWQPLWDGKSLGGWHQRGGGQWRVEDGTLLGTQSAEQAEEGVNGVLVTDETFDDFTVRTKFKAVEGNSGFYFRSEEVDEPVALHGFQAEVEPEFQTGGLYETGGRGWVVEPDPEKVKETYEPGEWTDLAVSAHGGWIVTHLNGQKIAELKNDDSRREGHIGLQMHSGHEMHVAFKDIQILRKVE